MYSVVFALFVMVLCLVHAQISFSVYLYSCDAATMAYTYVYYTQGCFQHPLGGYFKASCSGNTVKTYSGSNPTCPDTEVNATKTYTSGDCSNTSGFRYKYTCNYSPPQGSLTNFYNNTVCSGSALYATYATDGCRNIGSSYYVYKCPSYVSKCSDSLCTNNCVPDSSINSTTSACSGFGPSLSTKVTCSMVVVLITQTQTFWGRLYFT
jgi:hypothetical protein